MISPSSLRNSKKSKKRPSAWRPPTRFPCCRSQLGLFYGHVQVLFDVNFEVARGELLALLDQWRREVHSPQGHQRHGRSRARCDPSPTTVPSPTGPELRVRMVVQLMEGGAVFAPLGVEENLKMACFLEESREVGRRVDRSERSCRFSENGVPVPRPAQAASSRCSVWPWRSSMIRRS